MSLREISVGEIVNHISLAKRCALISHQPLFSHFPREEIDALAQVVQEVHYKAGDQIVREGDFVDSVFFIAAGKAKIIQREVRANKPLHDLVVAMLEAGETIGLDDKGFFSSHGKRTATVIALDDMSLLRLDVKSLETFIKKHPVFDKSLKQLTELLLKLDFIKQAYPFYHLDSETIYSLTQEIQEISLPANTLIFSQGNLADSCYLIRGGEVEIFLTRYDGTERKLTTLGPGQLLGEAALLTSTHRNASAKTTCETKLLVLERALLLKAMEINAPFAQSVVGFMLNRLRPMRSSDVKEHFRSTKAGQLMMVLQNTKLNQYCQLSEEAWFIWQQLDGIQTIRDLTLSFFKRFKAFVPDTICSLLYNLANAGFVEIPSVSIEFEHEKPMTLWEKLAHFISGIARKEFTFNHIDIGLTKLYQNVIWLFYTWPFQFFFAGLVLIGFITFLHSYSHIAQLADEIQPNFWLFLLLLIPVSTIAILCHEAGHAFTAKKFDYSVPRIGVGWFFLAPIAFTDTSALWLANQKERVAVDVAGICMDLIVASVLSLLAVFVSAPEVSIFLWLFSLFIYFNAFKNLSPIKEYDGYFLMVDILDTYQLRKLSLRWLVKTFPRILHNPALLKKHTAEVCYWVSCTIYLALYIFIMILVLQALFKVFSVTSILGISPLHFSALLAGLALLALVISIWREIKRYRVT